VSALVTGASGFIGAWLTRALLERGMPVVALDKRPTARPGRGGAASREEAGAGESTLALLGLENEVIGVADGLEDPAQLARTISAREVEIVFHLAAEPIVNLVQAAPLRAFETNVRGTWNVLEACRVAAVDGVVVASSDKAYGHSDTLPYTEEMPLRPTAPYEASKAAADLIARSYWPSYGLPVAVTRLANVYGGGDLNFSRLVPEAVCAALSGRQPVLRSDGSPQRDLLYIDDAVAAYLAIADNLASDDVRGNAFNAGSGSPRRVSEVTDLIGRLAGVEATPDVRGSGTPSGEIERQFVDPSRIREATGWRAQVELEDGIRQTIEWYASHPTVRPPTQEAS